MEPIENINPKKIPVTNGFQTETYNDIVGMVCRKKGQVSVEFCAMCPDFEPAVKGFKESDAVLEGMDGIDPRTGNSYATCKWFGEIVRVNPFFAEVRRKQESRFGKW